MDLRLAKTSDAPAIVAIWNTEVVGSTYVFELVPRSLQAQERWLAEHGGPHPAVVAVEGGEVVGFASLTAYRPRPAYSATVEDSVYVAGPHRGCGVGRALLGEVLRLARTGGFHTVIARIADSNSASVALHRRAGFALVGTEQEVGRKFGRWLDVAVMQLML